MMTTLADGINVIQLVSMIGWLPRVKCLPGQPSPATSAWAPCPQPPRHTACRVRPGAPADHTAKHRDFDACALRPSAIAAVALRQQGSAEHLVARPRHPGGGMPRGHTPQTSTPSSLPMGNGKRQARAKRKLARDLSRQLLSTCRGATGRSRCELPTSSAR